MKFKYNLNKDLKILYDEGNYLIAYKEQFIKGKKTKIKSYSKELILYIILMIICFILNMYIIDSILLSLIIFILVIIMIYMLSIFYIGYNQYKKGDHKGTIIIDKNGITDKSNVEISFPWEKVELLGITKNALIVVVNKPFIILLEPNEDIVKEILKHKDVKIIKSV